LMELHEGNKITYEYFFPTLDLSPNDKINVIVEIIPQGGGRLRRFLKFLRFLATGR